MNLQRLFLIAALGVSGGLLADDCDTNRACCNTNTNTNSNCGGCCGTNLNPICGGSIITNKTVYVDITVGQSATYLHDNFFRNMRMDLREDGWQGAFQIVPFGGKTTADGSNGLGVRFGLNGKRCLNVVEGVNTFLCLDQACPPVGNNSSTLINSRDIDPQNFNLETVGGVFQSTICFCPQENIGGAVLSWKQGFGCQTDCIGSSRWWFEINAPVVNVRHNMNLVETIITPSGGAMPATLGLDNTQVVGTMQAAFCQPNWNYGKICGCQESTQLANLEFKVGFNNNYSDCCDSSFYIGFVAPNSRHRTGQFVFEPVLGQDHWGAMWGSTWDVCFIEWGNSGLYCHLALDSRWWFQKAETRSFDLVGKPWSRYQEMYASLTAATAASVATSVRAGTSGINIMTQCVQVTPGYQIDANTALMYKGCNFMVEVGHTFYAREAEKICPKWAVGPAVKAASGPGSTNIARTIGNQFPAASDLNFTTGAPNNYAIDQITVCQVDWNSGAHEGILAHTIYGAVGYDREDWCYPTFFSIGGAYDFQPDDFGTSVERRWVVFGKIGFSF